MSKKSAKNTGGPALSPPSGKAPKRKPKGHRYKFLFVIPAYSAHKLDADGQRSPQGILALARCIASIQNQTDRDCRVIVVNDGNSVEAGELVNEYRKDIPDVPITYLQAPFVGRRGGHESINLALSTDISDCDFVTFLNGDNTIRPTYIEDMHHPDYDIVTCMVRMNDFLGITLNGHSFSRAKIDRLNYTISTGIAKLVRHKQHLDADCDYVLDALALSERGVYHVDKELAEHN